MKREFKTSVFFIHRNRCHSAATIETASFGTAVDLSCSTEKEISDNCVINGKKFWHNISSTTALFVDRDS